MKLPVYELLIDDECEGMYAMALVANPATECSWLAFNKEDSTKKVSCTILNEDEHKVLCVICRCDFPIYRIFDDEECYVVWHKQTIENMAQKFLKNSYQTAVNIEHDDNAYVDGVEIQELFIKDVAKGIDPKGFEGIEDGSLFGVYKIENEKVWEAIKEGIFTSVSLEGNFKIVPEKKMNPEVIDSLEELLGLI